MSNQASGSSDSQEIIRRLNSPVGKDVWPVVLVFVAIFILIGVGRIVGFRKRISTTPDINAKLEAECRKYAPSLAYVRVDFHQDMARVGFTNDIPRGIQANVAINVARSLLPFTGGRVVTVQVEISNEPAYIMVYHTSSGIISETRPPKSKTSPKANDTPFNSNERANQ